jgi:hypothetical protein
MLAVKRIVQKVQKLADKRQDGEVLRPYYPVEIAESAVS